MQQIPEEYLKMSREELTDKINSAITKLGDDLLIIAHHYQKDEVVEFAQATGDSLQLAQIAAANKRAKHIVFCGVHFMAETADMLTEDDQHVYLPDEAAGCFMADMANDEQLRICWNDLAGKFGDTIMPITYINSTAAVKAFVGEHGGTTVTSSNSEKIVQWALTQKERILFLPDQHLGRNTAYALGIPLTQMALYKPLTGELVYEGALEDVKIILWDGYCSVHQQFTPDHIAFLRHKYPEIKIIVHPECPIEVVLASDEYGSTNRILNVVADSPEGTHWAIGTDNNLVGRMMHDPHHKIEYLNPMSCACLTMNRIKLPHLAWNLDNILNGNFTQKITVDEETTKLSNLALERMLELS
ncbi:MAG: quinolinate synthase NadA [Lactobacillales bacterium]|jgi:quinolinate synthase|nr:quinolinate synthase NadA [Lactobacillales bacterium]